MDINEYIQSVTSNLDGTEIEDGVKLLHSQKTGLMSDVEQQDFLMNLDDMVNDVPVETHGSQHGIPQELLVQREIVKQMKVNQQGNPADINGSGATKVSELQKLINSTPHDEALSSADKLLPNQNQNDINMAKSNSDSMIKHSGIEEVYDNVF